MAAGISPTADRVDVSGGVTQTDLPLLPRRPDRIEFNASEAVLAETRAEAWRPWSGR
jgi:hypothetical protein